MEALRNIESGVLVLSKCASVGLRAHASVCSIYEIWAICQTPSVSSMVSGGESFWASGLDVTSNSFVLESWDVANFVLYRHQIDLHDAIMAVVLLLACFHGRL